MPKVSSQRKPEWNYQIIDLCYGCVEGKEEGIQEISRNNSNSREDRTVKAMEMGGLIEASQDRDIITKTNLIIENRKIIRMM